MKKIKFIIQSELENVELVGMSLKKLCSLTSFSENQAFQIELCAVEAINNSIIHAYNGAIKYEVEVVMTIRKDCLLIEVCDRGKAMNQKILEKADLTHKDDYLESLEKLSETGRGLGFIKEFMDNVTYKTDSGVNCLKMIKYF